MFEEFSGQLEEWSSASRTVHTTSWPKNEVDVTLQKFCYALFGQQAEELRHSEVSGLSDLLLQLQHSTLASEHRDRIQLLKTERELLVEQGRAWNALYEHYKTQCTRCTPAGSQSLNSTSELHAVIRAHARMVKSLEEDHRLMRDDLALVNASADQHIQQLAAGSETVRHNAIIFHHLLTIPELHNQLEQTLKGLQQAPAELGQEVGVSQPELGFDAVQAALHKLVEEYTAQHGVCYTSLEYEESRHDGGPREVRISEVPSVTASAAGVFTQHHHQGGGGGAGGGAGHDQPALLGRDYLSMRKDNDVIADQNQDQEGETMIEWSIGNRKRTMTKWVATPHHTWERVVVDVEEEEREENERLRREQGIDDAGALPAGALDRRLSRSQSLLKIVSRENSKRIQNVDTNVEPSDAETKNLSSSPREQSGSANFAVILPRVGKIAMFIAASWALRYVHRFVRRTNVYQSHFNKRNYEAEKKNKQKQFLKYEKVMERRSSLPQRVVRSPFRFVGDVFDKCAQTANGLRVGTVHTAQSLSKLSFPKIKRSNVDLAARNSGTKTGAVVVEYVGDTEFTGIPTLGVRERLVTRYLTPSAPTVDAVPHVPIESHSSSFKHGNSTYINSNFAGVENTSLDLETTFLREFQPPRVGQREREASVSERGELSSSADVELRTVYEAETVSTPAVTVMLPVRSSEPPTHLPPPPPPTQPIGIGYPIDACPTGWDCQYK